MLIICLALAVLGVILFFGLRPKDLTLTNNVEWLKTENGILVRKFGIAFSPPFIDGGKPGSIGQREFTIELAAKTETLPSGQFRFLLVFDNGDDSRQLLLGQWRSWLILMNGDDYAHKEKRKRLSVNAAVLPSDTLFLTITAGSDGTTLYVNGKKAAARNGFGQGRNQGHGR